ncbi:MBL fold metallo-hydrolase [Cellvibrio sp.]
MSQATPNHDKAHFLYNKDGHLCIQFSDLVVGEGIQSNQFLIIDNQRAALIDPGGDLTYTPLNIEISKRVKANQLDYIFASHQDPDIIASLPRWMMHTQCQVVTSKLWSRFLPHLASQFVTQQLNHNLDDRIIAMPDSGGTIAFGRSEMIVLPAHFLHSVGNFHFYDPVSKILFSGDMGASLIEDHAEQPVVDFESHIPHMLGFHQRYMASNKACRLWANMVRQIDVEMMVPQHGSPFVGRAMVNNFLDWISNLACGIDLMNQQHFDAGKAGYKQ